MQITLLTSAQPLSQSPTNIIVVFVDADGTVDQPSQKPVWLPYQQA